MFFSKKVLLVGFVLLATCACLAAQNPLDRTVNFTCNRLSAAAALTELSRQTGIGIAFSPDFFEENARPVSLLFVNEKLSGVLEALLYDTGVGVQLVENQVVLFKKFPSPPARFTISGTIEDEESKERLIGASVFELTRRVGLTANEFGFFSLTLPAGEAQIQFSYLGYAQKIESFDLHENRRVKITLRVGGSLPEITVFSKTDSLETSILPSNLQPDLPLGAAKTLPNLGGEADLGRLAMLLPGVSTGADGLGGIHIRGGDAENTLVLFDDVPVYYGTHALGMFTIFNPDVVRSARLWKGELPARFGSRLGSVLDVRTKEGNLLHPEGEASVGITASRFAVQTPIFKQKMSLLLTGRQSTFGPILSYFSKKNKREKGRLGETVYKFFDFNAKLNWEPTDRDRFYLSFYKGQDRLTDDESEQTVLAGNKPGDNERQLFYRWKNQFLAARWNHVWTEKLFSNATATFSRFTYENDYFFHSTVMPRPDSTLLLEFQQLDYESQVQDYSLKLDFDYFQNAQNHWKIGAMTAARQFIPGVGSKLEYEVLDTAASQFLLRPDTLRGWEWAAYAEDEWQPKAWFHANFGLRASVFQTNGSFFPNLEPRGSMRFRLKQGLFLKTSGALTVQYLHVLRGWDVGTPADLWIPASRGAPPQHGAQIELGLEKNFNQKWLASVVGFWQKTRGLRELKSTAVVNLFPRDALLGKNIRSKLTEGRGRSAGVELLVSGTVGGFSGWASYTFSKAERQFDSLNFGRKFPFRYDRRHQFSTAFLMKLGDFVDFTAVFTIASGDAITSDTTEAVAGNVNFLDLNTLQFNFRERNNQRLPTYQRLDAGLNFRLPKGRGRLENHLSIGVYNTLSNHNARYEYRLSNGQRRRLEGLPAVPYLNFSSKF